MQLDLPRAETSLQIISFGTPYDMVILLRCVVEKALVTGLMNVLFT